MLKISFCLAAAMLLAQAAFGQSIPIAEDAMFVVHVDLDEARETKLGEKVLEAVRTLAASEFGKGKDPDEAFEDVEKTLGFDPFNELHNVTVVGRNLMDPLKGLQVVVGMGNTTGNLEGLMLAIPGYDSSEHGDYLIHSVSPDGDMQVYGAIHGSRTKKVVIATSSDDVKSLLAALGKGRSSSPSDSDSSLSLDPDAFLQVRVNEIPDLDDLDGPPKTIAKLLKAVSLSVKEGKGDLSVQLKLTADGEKHAEQLQQLAQGLIAMVSILQDSEDADEDLEKVAEVLDGLQVELSGDVVELNLEVPESMVIDFLRDEVDLPLSE